MKSAALRNAKTRRVARQIDQRRALHEKSLRAPGAALVSREPVLRVSHVAIHFPTPAAQELATLMLDKTTHVGRRISEEVADLMGYGLLGEPLLKAIDAGAKEALIISGREGGAPSARGQAQPPSMSRGHAGRIPQAQEVARNVGIAQMAFEERWAIRIHECAEWPPRDNAAAHPLAGELPIELSHDVQEGMPPHSEQVRLALRVRSYRTLLLRAIRAFRNEAPAEREKVGWLRAKKHGSPGADRYGLECLGCNRSLHSASRSSYLLACINLSDMSPLW